jgi:hypothetical protein
VVLTSSDEAIAFSRGFLTDFAAQVNATGDFALTERKALRQPDLMVKHGACWAKFSVNQQAD